VIIDDVVLNKAAIIERTLARVVSEYAGDARNLRENETRQDAIVLNILRTAEAIIDLAMHLVARDKLGIPQSSREAFDLLAGAGVISVDHADALKRMVGFRNIAVHGYQRLSLSSCKPSSSDGLVTPSASQPWR